MSFLVEEIPFLNTTWRVILKAVRSTAFKMTKLVALERDRKVSAPWEGTNLSRRVWSSSDVDR